jgi:hypothetical protein
VTTSDLVLQPVPVMMDIMKTHLVNVLPVEKLVKLVSMNTIVIDVPETEKLLQNVDVQPELSIVVLLTVAHVTKNVIFVKENGIIVLIVLISESIPQPVNVQMDIMKNLI